MTAAALLLTMALVGGAAGHSGDQEDEGDRGAAPPIDPTTLAGRTRPPTIRTIHIERRDVVDPASGYTGSLVYDVVNRIHLRTKERVLRRELLVREGEPLDPTAIAESSVNLRRLSFIADARVETLEAPGDSVDLRVVTEDAWSTTLIASYGLDGGRTRWALGLAELNLLGRGWYLRALEAQRNGRRRGLLELAEPRAFGSRVTVGGLAARNDPGHAFSLYATLPFYTLDAPWSWGASALTAEAEQDVYDEAVRVSSQTRTRTRAAVHAVRSEGPEGGPKLRYGLGAAHDVVEMGALQAGTALAPEGSRARLGAATVFVSGTHVRYEARRDLEASGRTEDVPTGWTASVGLGPGWADAPDASGLHYGVYVEGSGEMAGTWGRQYAGLAAGRRALWADGETERLRWGDLRLHSQRLPHQTLGVRVAAVALDRSADPAFLHTGGGVGPRGVDSHWMAGSKRVWATAEDRILTPWHAFTVRLGFTLFADAAGAWPEDEPVDLSDVLVTVGGGVRLDMERSTGVGAIHIEYGVPVRGPGAGLPSVGVRVSRLYHRLGFRPPVPGRLGDLLE